MLQITDLNNIIKSQNISKSQTWLVVWNIFYFSTIPTDFHSIIFSDGLAATTNQMVMNGDIFSLLMMLNDG